MLGIRRAGAWFGWQPSEVMALPYSDFMTLLLDESEERRQAAEQRGRQWRP